MKCPNCFSEMVLTSRFCVELDKCPQCEGIWLDRCEIEKIADKNNSKVGHELHVRNQFDDNPDCGVGGQDKGYYFYKNEYRENASIDEMFDFEY